MNKKQALLYCKQKNKEPDEDVGHISLCRTYVPMKVSRGDYRIMVVTLRTDQLTFEKNVSIQYGGLIGYGSDTEDALISIIAQMTKSETKKKR